ncbi:MAG: hypothetical protein ABI870_14555 [Rhodanobacter sp.]
MLLESKNYNAMRKQASRSLFDSPDQPVICSSQFAKSKADDIAAIGWDLVVMDEAHRLRNVYNLKGLQTAFNGMSHQGRLWKSFYPSSVQR